MRFPSVAFCLCGCFLTAPLCYANMPPKWICLGLPSPVKNIEIHDGKTGELKAKISTENPETTTQKQCGLAYRTSIRPEQGMWFSFTTTPTMWMKNTLIPLELLFVDEDDVVQCIRRGTPFDETPIQCENPSVAVLEVPEGTAAKHQLIPGDQIIHVA